MIQLTNLVELRALCLKTLRAHGPLTASEVADMLNESTKFVERELANLKEETGNLIKVKAYIRGKSGAWKPQYTTEDCEEAEDPTIHGPVHLMEINETIRHVRQFVAVHGNDPFVLLKLEKF